MFQHGTCYYGLLIPSCVPVIVVLLYCNRMGLKFFIHNWDNRVSSSSKKVKSTIIMFSSLWLLMGCFLCFPLFSLLLVFLVLFLSCSILGVAYGLWCVPLFIISHGLYELNESDLGFRIGYLLKTFMWFILVKLCSRTSAPQVDNNLCLNGVVIFISVQ